MYISRIKRIQYITSWTITILNKVFKYQIKICIDIRKYVHMYELIHHRFAYMYISTYICKYVCMRLISKVPSIYVKLLLALDDDNFEPVSDARL